jgi:aryl-alcohol dehydrogenase-like predicted oxidoreductase
MMAGFEAFSRAMLGTVQFGLPYGVANRTGMPDEQTVAEIVAAAVDGGVTAFDTAASYGVSEEVLGRVFRRLGLGERVAVVTKVRPLSDVERADGARAREAIERSVAESRRKLGLERLAAVLFHREEDAVWLDELKRLADRGWFDRCGVSCDNVPGPAVAFASDPRVAALQVPANLLDTRQLRSGVFAVAARQRVAVFIRSAFLQGLLLMPEASIPPGLAGVVPWRRRLEAIAASAGLGMGELAIRYLLSLKGVTSVLIGVETLEQVRQNLSYFDAGPLPADVLSELEQFAPTLTEQEITPRLWPAR